MAQVIRTWGIAVCTAALLSGILQTAAGEGIARRGLRFAVGLFLLLAVLKPIREIRLDDLRFEAESRSIPSVESADTQQTDMLLEQTETQLVKRIDAELRAMDVRANGIRVEIHTDIENRIYLQQVDVLLPPAYMARKEEINSALHTLLGVQANLMFVNG